MLGFAVWKSLSAILIILGSSTANFIDTSCVPVSSNLDDESTSSDYLPMRPHKQNQKLSIDTALVHVNIHANTSVYIFAQVDVCDKCSFLPASSTPVQDGYFSIDTRWNVAIRVSYNKTITNCTDWEICRISVHPTEYGNYSLHIKPQSQPNERCDFSPEEEAPDSNIPIYVALGVFAGLAVLCMVVNFSYRNNIFIQFQRFFQTDRLVFSDLGAPSTNVSPKDNNTIESLPQEPPRRRRVRSLDAFRGFCLVIMVFVNYHGGKYWFFKHSTWNGLTLADPIMPWFTFIIGTSIALSFHKLVKNKISRRVLVCKVVIRTLILFGIGLILNTGGCDKLDFQYLRIPGVLQRLAISYFGVAILQVFCVQVDDPYRHKKWAPVRDILPYWPEWLVNAAVLATHLCLTFLLPVPGCPKGYLGPGGLHMNSSYVNCTGGAAGHIDRQIFGNNHIYQTPTCRLVYHTKVPYDPEGILGTMTSVFMCFLGLQAGKILLIYPDWKNRVVRWLVWFLLLGAIAGGLTKFSLNDGIIPICKNLWSLTFVLSLASMAFLLLTIFYMLIDVYNIWSGTPFFYPGMNSILVYVCHEVFENFIPVSWKVPNTHATLLAMNLWGSALWTLVAMYLYYQGIFITI